MTHRIPLLVAVIAASPAVGFAQGFSYPLPTPPPIPVPGTNQLYPAASPFTPPSLIRPWTGFGYSPWAYGPSVYAPGFSYPWVYLPPTVRSSAPTPPPPLVGAGGPGPDLTNAEFPASFTLEFPADVKLWLNGQEVPGAGRTRVLTSPTLKAGGAFTFDVRAEWTTDGTRYEWDRAIALSAGDKARVTVARGFLIKD